MIVNDRSPLELAAPDAMVTQVACVTSVVTFVTMVCFCRVIVVPDSDELSRGWHCAGARVRHRERARRHHHDGDLCPKWVFPPSETVSENVSVPPVAGAVKVGLAVVGPVRTTAVPLVWAHWYVNTAPSGSDDADPSNVTTAPAPTD